MPRAARAQKKGSGALQPSKNNLREFFNYRHPDPRRGEPRVCSTQLDAFPEDPVDPGRSAAELREAHLEAPLSQFWHIWPENGHPF